MPPKYGLQDIDTVGPSTTVPGMLAWRMPWAARWLLKYHRCCDFLRMNDFSDIGRKVKWNRLRSWYQADLGTGNCRNTKLVINI